MMWLQIASSKVCLSLIRHLVPLRTLVSGFSSFWVLCDTGSSACSSQVPKFRHVSLCPKTLVSAPPVLQPPRKYRFLSSVPRRIYRASDWQRPRMLGPHRTSLGQCSFYGSSVIDSIFKSVWLLGGDNSDWQQLLLIDSSFILGSLQGFPLSSFVDEMCLKFNIM